MIAFLPRSSWPTSEHGALMQLAPAQSFHASLSPPRPARQLSGRALTTASSPRATEATTSPRGKIPLGPRSTPGPRPIPPSTTSDQGRRGAARAFAVLRPRRLSMRASAASRRISPPSLRWANSALRSDSRKRRARRCARRARAGRPQSSSTAIWGKTMACKLSRRSGGRETISRRSSSERGRRLTTGLTVSRRAPTNIFAKPFDVRELAVRVEALLRRANDPRARLQQGDLEMNLVERTVRCAGRQVDLLADRIQAARISDAPSRSGVVKGEAARGRLAIQIRRPQQRRRCSDRKPASQARPDRRTAIYRLRPCDRLQAEGRSLTTLVRLQKRDVAADSPAPVRSVKPSAPALRTTPSRSAV